MSAKTIEIHEHIASLRNNVALTSTSTEQQYTIINSIAGSVKAGKDLTAIGNGLSQQGEYKANGNMQFNTRALNLQQQISSGASVACNLDGEFVQRELATIRAGGDVIFHNTQEVAINAAVSAQHGMQFNLEGDNANLVTNAKQLVTITNTKSVHTNAPIKAKDGVIVTLTEDNADFVTNAEVLAEGLTGIEVTAGKFVNRDACKAPNAQLKVHTTSQDNYTIDNSGSFTAARMDIVGNGFAQRGICETEQEMACKTANLSLEAPVASKNGTVTLDLNGQFSQTANATINAKTVNISNSKTVETNAAVTAEDVVTVKLTNVDANFVAKADVVTTGAALTSLNASIALEAATTAVENNTMATFLEENLVNAGYMEYLFANIRPTAVTVATAAASAQYVVQAEAQDAEEAAQRESNLRQQMARMQALELRGGSGNDVEPPSLTLQPVLAVGRGIKQGAKSYASSSIYAILHPVDTAIDLGLTVWDGYNAIADVTFGVSSTGSRERNAARGLAVNLVMEDFVESDGIRRAEMLAHGTTVVGLGVLTGSATANVTKAGMLKLYDVRKARQTVIATSSPAEIAWGTGKLSARQQALLDSLPKIRSQLKLHKSDISVTDLAALTAHTGDELALFTRGSQRLIIRGNSSGVVLSIEKLQFLREQGFRWSAHSHPSLSISGESLIASGGDRAALEIFGQERSLILDSFGRRNVFDQTTNSHPDIQKLVVETDTLLWRPRR